MTWHAFIVTTDDGEVMAQWNDTGDEIGDISKPFASRLLVDELARNVLLARKQEGRNPATGEPNEP